MTQFAEWTPKKTCFYPGQEAHKCSCVAAITHDQHTEQTQCVRFSKCITPLTEAIKRAPQSIATTPSTSAQPLFVVASRPCPAPSDQHTLEKHCHPKIPADSNGTSPTKASAVPRPEPGVLSLHEASTSAFARAFASALTPVVRSPPARQALETFRREPSMQHSVAPPHFVCSTPGTCPRY